MEPGQQAQPGQRGRPEALVRPDQSARLGRKVSQGKTETMAIQVRLVRLDLPELRARPEAQEPQVRRALPARLARRVRQARLDPLDRPEQLVALAFKVRLVMMASLVI